MASPLVLSTNHGMFAQHLFLGGVLRLRTYTLSSPPVLPVCREGSFGCEAALPAPSVSDASPHARRTGWIDSPQKPACAHPPTFVGHLENGTMRCCPYTLVIRKAWGTKWVNVVRTCVAPLTRSPEHPFDNSQDSGKTPFSPESHPPQGGRRRGRDLPRRPRRTGTPKDARG